jgi:hypothetical protein
MEIKLNKWEKNGFKRIYVNGAPIGTKIWFQADSGGKLIKKTGEIFNSNDQYFADKAVNEAYALMENKIGSFGFEIPEFSVVFAAL